MSTNPYAAPKTHVADVPEHVTEGNFVAGGRSRPAGRGWGWISAAGKLTKERFWLWMGFFIIFALIGLGLSMIPLIGAFVVYLVMPVLLGGVMLTCDKARRGDDIGFGDFFSGFGPRFARLAGIGVATLVMYFAILAVIGAIFGSTMALIFMGTQQPDASQPAIAISMVIAWLVMLALSVPVYMAVWFSYPLVTINNFAVIEALKTSFKGCLKNIVPFLVYGVMMFLLTILALIPLVLGWLVLNPVLNSASSLRFFALIPLMLGFLILGPILLASFYTGYRDIYYKD